jgi:hypothetical protein
MRTGNIRVVLTWGLEPADLDAHLSGPICGTTERFHITHLDMEPVPYAELDVDDLDGEGPETITIWAYDDKWVPGEYDFWVYNYSRKPDFKSSGAVVTVFKEGEQVDQFAVADEPEVETTTFDIWRVVNLIIWDEEGTLELNRGGYGFEPDPDDSNTVPPPLVPTAPTEVECPLLPGGSSQPSSAATTSGGSHGSDPLAAAELRCFPIGLLPAVPMHQFV